MADGIALTYHGVQRPCTGEQQTCAGPTLPTRRRRDRATRFLRGRSKVQLKFRHLPLRSALIAALIVFLTAPKDASAARSPRRQAIDQAKMLGEVDAATLGLENEFTNPLPKAEATLHGSVALQYIAPLGGQSSTAAAMLQGDALLRRGRYGLLLTPRLRFESLAAPVTSGSLFLQQAYAFVRVPNGEIKVGKVLAQLGRLWDFGMYGPIIASYDFKLMPDLGVSFEGQADGIKRRSLSYALQYYWLDGRTFSVANESMLSRKKARRAHNVTARIVPQGCLGKVHVAWGLSGQTYRSLRNRHHQVWRAATDVTIGYRWLEAFAEVGRQTRSDISSTNVPVPPFSYLWAGTQASLGRMRVRFHVNTVRHEAPAPGWGLQLQPGAEYAINPSSSVVVEGSAWLAQAGSPVPSEQNVFVFGTMRY